MKHECQKLTVQKKQRQNPKKSYISGRIFPDKKKRQDHEQSEIADPYGRCSVNNMPVERNKKNDKHSKVINLEITQYICFRRFFLQCDYSLMIRENCATDAW